MREHFDKRMLREQALLERLSISRPQFLKSLQENKLFYLYAAVIYSAEDALSYLFGQEKLAFSIKAAFEERCDAHASSEQHAFESTATGIAITASIGVLLVGVQAFGTYFADDENLDSKPLKKLLAKIIAPYLRDCLQGIKWAYKGVKSLLGTIFFFLTRCNDMIFKILFPISIAVAAVSLLNRVFIRTVRNERKKNQKKNRELAFEIYEKTCDIKFRKKLPETTEDLQHCANSFIYVTEEKQDPNDTCEIYYINEHNTSEKITLTDEQKKEFNQKLQEIQRKNILENLKKDFAENIVFLSQLPESTAKYTNSLIYLTDPALAEDERLYNIDQNNQIQLDNRSFYFSRRIKNEIFDKSSLLLQPQQIKELLLLINSNKKIGFDIVAWNNYKKTIDPKEQSHKSTIACYVSAVLSSLIDGSYFYLGVLFMTAMNPSFFIATLAMSSIMLLVCLTARIYEEYNYQRIFRITKIEVELSKARAECHILQAEIERLQNEGKEIAPIVKQLQDALKKYQEQQQKLEKEVVFSRYSALLEGLKNGLSTQGIISSIMFLTVAIMLLLGASCPPIFILTMSAAGMCALTISVVRYMYSYNDYIKNVTRLESILIPDYNESQPAKEQYNALLPTKEKLDNRIIQKPPDHRGYEHCEPFRLVNTVLPKFIKNVKEITFNMQDQDSTWMSFITITFSIPLMFAFFYRGVKKVFAPDNEHITVVDNTGLTEPPPQKENNSTVTKYTQNVYSLFTNNKKTTLVNNDTTNNNCVNQNYSA